eukprot:gb/GFBE01049945.1/.p1 GENE.gb/GFBE01049945.1/~~gb/GFBE01049945.1/.p1  ORF type:complete len:308 (+),score=55.76 gb/GFBE01049945.1/:1-924(+)
MPLPTQLFPTLLGRGEGKLTAARQDDFLESGKNALSRHPAADCKSLEDEYELAEQLGEGSFGIVFACTRRSTGQDLAVKLIDVSQTPLHAVMREARILQSMDHPNIVKYHGTHHDGFCVGIVMSKFYGGDVVEYLQSHASSHGMINCQDITHVAQQMLAAIEHLHNRLVIHRDIKGDNFLMDRRNLKDPDCRVVLIDFGSATHAFPGERLTSWVGTRLFWSPEIYAESYGNKIDLWALGVVMCGLLTGNFPFQNESEILNKDFRAPRCVHPLCAGFVYRLLDKDESRRMSAAEALQHPYVSETGWRC